MPEAIILRTPLFALAICTLALSQQGCVATTIAGATVGVASLAVGTTVKVTGAAVGATANAMGAVGRTVVGAKR